MKQNIKILFVGKYESYWENLIKEVTRILFRIKKTNAIKVIRVFNNPILELIIHFSNTFLLTHYTSLNFIIIIFQ